jgi:hypothetical protein
MAAAQSAKDPNGAYYLASRTSEPVFTQSITSFLCTDDALEVFQEGAKAFQELNASSDKGTEKEAWANDRCLDEARTFFKYADVEVLRGRACHRD